MLAGKAAIGTTKLAAKGIAVGTKTAYDHRAEMASATKTVSKAAATTVGVVGYQQKFFNFLELLEFAYIFQCDGGGGGIGPGHSWL